MAVYSAVIVPLPGFTHVAVITTLHESSVDVSKFILKFKRSKIIARLTFIINNNKLFM